MLRRILRRRQTTLFPAILEAMEPRQLLAASTLIDGTPGDDRIIIAYGANVYDIIILSAPGFADGTVLHDAHNLVVNGGDGNDYIEIQQGGYPADNRARVGNWATLRGGNGDDTLIGGDNGTEFDGGAGIDHITGRQPRGWRWMDSLTFADAIHGISVRLDLGQVEDDGFGNHETVRGVGDVTGTPWDDVIYAGGASTRISGGDGSDFLAGNAHSANLSGGDGDDTLLGGRDNDRLDPGAGNDVVHGGGGVDTLIYESETRRHGATVRLDRQLVTNDGSGGVDRLQGIENVMIYGHTADTIYGDGNDNDLEGDEGADFIFGGAGNDYLQGGDGATLLGGSGDDKIPTDYRSNVIDGGLGKDTIMLWGYSDSPDRILPDTNDIIMDHRSSSPTPEDMNLPQWHPLPYKTPSEKTTAGKDKKFRRMQNIGDLPFTARLLNGL